MKKFLSLLLVAAMALSLLSVSALAEEPAQTHGKKLLSIMP